MRRLTMAAVASAAAVALAACSVGPPTPAPTDLDPARREPVDLRHQLHPVGHDLDDVTAAGTIAITVTGRTVTPAPAQVDLPVGQTLTLVVTSDHDDELHAHGFEVEEDIKAGVPTTVALTGKEAGRLRGGDCTTPP